MLQYLHAIDSKFYGSGFYVLQAAEHFPLAADLSDSNLECFPDNLLVNDKLEILNLSGNSLQERCDADSAHIDGWLDDLPRYVFLKIIYCDFKLYLYLCITGLRNYIQQCTRVIRLWRLMLVILTSHW
jgi:hypothetical protein